MEERGMVEATNGEKIRGNGAPAAYLVFLAIAYLLTGILLLLLAFLLYQFQLSRNAVSIGIIVIYLLSNFVAGFLAGKKAKSKKYIWGLLMGSVYFLILAGMSLMMHSASGGTGLFTSFLLCAGGGTLGGMLS